MLPTNLLVVEKEVVVLVGDYITEGCPADVDK
jgi:hypothetical protein